MAAKDPLNVYLRLAYVQTVKFLPDMQDLFAVEFFSGVGVICRAFRQGLSLMDVHVPDYLCAAECFMGLWFKILE